jgi:6,7-dimethyl-8-ribityllumazine synthase
MSETIDAYADPAGGLAVAIVVSRYNASVTDRLLAGAREAYARRGGDPGGPAVLHAPGTFELPAICQAAAETGRFRGVVALGCLIRGQTRHDRYIAGAVAHGLVSVSLATGVPVTFGVLTVEDAQQAMERAGGSKGNKGADAMEAVLDTIATIDALASGESLTGRPAPQAKPDKAVGSR